MIIEINTDGLKDDQIDHLGKFLMGVFTKHKGPWLCARNEMPGVIEENDWVSYLIYFGKMPVYMKYRIPQKPELEYPHDPAYTFNNKYLCSYAFYHFIFNDGSVLERYPAGGFHWLKNNANKGDYNGK